MVCHNLFLFLILHDKIYHVSTDATLKHWVKKYGWKEENKTIIFIANQDENIKTKNITEKIDFENVAGLMAACL